MKAAKQICTSCKRRCRPAVTGTLQGHPFVLCKKCRDDFRKQVTEAGRALGVEFELIEE